MSQPHGCPLPRGNLSSAERAYAAFGKGDKFVAEGYVRTYAHQVDGLTRHGEEFIVKKFGHDTARTTYTVDRARHPATADPSPSVDTPTHDNPGASAPTAARANPAVSL